MALGCKFAVAHDLVRKYCMDIQYRITIVLGQNGRLTPILYNIQAVNPTYNAFVVIVADRRKRHASLFVALDVAPEFSTSKKVLT